MCSVLRTVVGAGLLLAIGCTWSERGSATGRPCEPDGGCLDGYLCSRDDICVAEAECTDADDNGYCDPACGDGFEDPNEDCDDRGESAACNSDCTTAVCGDSKVNATAGEECDTGTARSDVDADACRTNCRNPTCGDDVRDSGEDCDDGGESSTCNADCTDAECGDTVVNQTAGEECDTAGESATCNDDCTDVECGDGIINETAGEECDDGDPDSTDGCSSTCIVETNWTCNEEPSVCYLCGDGVIDTTAGEECDDNGVTPNDGCSATCTVEPFWNCDNSGAVETYSVCFLCGDGVTDSQGDVDEYCDDGDNDDCTADCNADCTGPANFCGDGITRCGEACDCAGDTCTTEGLALNDCTDFGFVSGAGLDCGAATCAFDASGCACSGGDLDTDGDGTCDADDDEDDDDGCPDRIDANFEFPPDMGPHLEILFITDNPSSLDSTDQAYRDVLEIQHNLTFLDCTDGDYTDDLPGIDVVFVSVSCSADDVNTKATNLAVPVVMNEEVLFDEMKFSAGNVDECDDDIEILDDTHFITRGFDTGRLDIHGGSVNDNCIGMTAGELGAGVEVLADRVAGATNAVLFVYEQGAELEDGSTAPARRVGFGPADPTNWNDTARTLLVRSLLWAAGETADLYADGDAFGTDCDTCPELFDPGQDDLDGDGFGDPCDCDHRVAACNVDCETNTDGDAGTESTLTGMVVPDCYEVACGSEPDLGSQATGVTADDCFWANAEAGRNFNDAMSRANTTATEDRILVTFPLTWSSGFACPNDGYQITFTRAITFNGGDNGIAINEGGCTFDGVRLSSGGHDVLHINENADGTVIRNFVIDGCNERGVLVAADNVVLEDLQVLCGGGNGNDRAGIQVANTASGTTIVGTVVSASVDDAIQIDGGAVDTTIDHCTLMDSTYGVRTLGATNGLCVRNNIFYDLDDAVSFASDTGWATTGTCVAPLADGTWNNAVFNSDTCSSTCTTNCTEANCLPTEELRFFEWSGSWAIDPGLDANYCLGTPVLIDAGADLDPDPGSPLFDAYDLNGSDPEHFNDGPDADATPAPDVGARESGSGVCRAP